MQRQLHWSHIETYLMCGERYRRRYVLGEIIPPGVAAVCGSAAHLAARLTLRQKMDDGTLPDVDDCETAARDHVSRIFARGAYRLVPEERTLGIEKCRADTIDRAVAFAEAHRMLLAPRLRPIRVEHKWVVKLRDHDFDLGGTTDEVDERDGQIEVRDLKTGSKIKKPEHSRQLVMYALAERVTDPQQRMPRKCWLDNVTVSKRGVTVTPLSTTITDADFVSLMRTVETAARGIESCVFLPTNLDSWTCSRKWCGFHDGCPYVRGRRVVAPRGG